MTWFKVDDALHAHRKVAKAGDAMALWVVAGSWCAQQLTDGFVPDYMAARLMTGGAEMAERLVEAEMWVADEQDGDSGWRFNDWEEFNPTAEEVEEKRSAARERMRRAREKKSQRNTSAGTDERDTNITRSSDDVRANSERSSEQVRLTPSRPDPSREDQDHAPPDEAADRDADPPDRGPPDGGVTATVDVDGFDEPFPVATRGVPLTGEIIRWALDHELAEREFRTPLEDARLAVETIAGTIGRKGKAVQAAIAVVGDYVATIRGDQLDSRTWGMLQSAVSNHGPTAVLDALAEALDRGAGLDGGHEVKGTVAVVEYALAIVRGEQGAAA